MSEELKHIPDEVFQGEFKVWWEDEGQFCRAGGGYYERTFAFQAWRHLYPLLMQARAELSAIKGGGEAVKPQWPEIVSMVNEVLGSDVHKYPCERGSIGHEMTGINFNSLTRIIDRVIHRYTHPPVVAEAEPVDCGHAACKALGEPHPFCEFVRSQEAAPPASGAVPVPRELLTVACSGGNEAWQALEEIRALLAKGVV